MILVIVIVIAALVAAVLVIVIVEMAVHVFTLVALAVTYQRSPPRALSYHIFSAHVYACCAGYRSSYMLAIEDAAEVCVSVHVAGSGKPLYSIAPHYTH